MSKSPEEVKEAMTRTRVQRNHTEKGDFTKAMKREYLEKMEKEHPELVAAYLGLSEPDPAPTTKAEKEKQMNERMKKAWDLIQADPTIHPFVLAVQMGLSESKVKTVLKKLEASGAIRQEVTEEGKRWVLDPQAAPGN